MKIIKAGTKRGINYMVVQSKRKIIIAQKQGEENYQIINDEGKGKTITPRILDLFIAAIIRQEKNHSP